MSETEVDRRLTILRESLPGQVLAGSDGRRYPVGACIGKGGQGWIYRASWNGTVDVVVKLLRPDLIAKEGLPRFQREAAILRTLSQQDAPNPHVVRFFDHAMARLTVPGTSDVWSLPFTVLEYVNGETLRSALEREQGRGLGLERTMRVVSHMVFALRDVHRHDIVHRDLKPTNVLLDNTRGREVAKVTDFGLSKVFQGDAPTHGLAGATYGYAPPEQFEKGNKRVGRPTDIFSLAVLFFEMLTGNEAFPYDPNAPAFLAVYRTLMGRPTLANAMGKLPPELQARPDVVAALDAVLARALEADPGKRQSTVAEFHEALEFALAKLGPNGPDTTPSTRRRAGNIDAAREPVHVSERRPTFEQPGDLEWRTVAPRIWTEPRRAIAVSPDQREAAAVGPDGLARWNGRAWTRVLLPGDSTPSVLHTVVWLGGRLVVAGASPIVTVRALDGSDSSFIWNLPGIAFHGAYADSVGVLLAGERTTAGGQTGILAMMTLHGPGFSLAWVDVPSAGPLRAVTRLDRAVMACGDGGAVAVMQGGQVETTHVCGPALYALTPTGDGAAIVVGGGGFVLRVPLSLDARLQAIQTTKTLRALARSPDGAFYCGGEDRRVLRWDPSFAPSAGAPRGGWVRTGTTSATGVSVRALSAAPDRVVAFCDDGSILDGVVPSSVSGLMPASR